MEIIPAILPKDYEEMKNKIALVRDHVSLVQIDLCDGVFVPSKTWPFATGGANDYNFQKIMREEEGMPFWEDVDFELDLLVADAVENFDIYTKLGPKKIIFHLEAVGDKEEFKHFIEGMDTYVRDSIQIGISINPQTPVDEIFSFVNIVDFVQLMGIDTIGFQNQEFDTKVLEHIKTLKEKYPDLKVSVDGGVNKNTAPLLREAGADAIVSGSAIFNSGDIIGTIEEFQNL